MPGLQVSTRGAKAAAPKHEGPLNVERALVFIGCLTMIYFRASNTHYHRRAAVSRSCAGWEGVVPAGYGRQALKGARRLLDGTQEGKD